MEGGLNDPREVCNQILDFFKPNVSWGKNHVIKWVTENFPKISKFHNDSQYASSRNLKQNENRLLTASVGLFQNI